MRTSKIKDKIEKLLAKAESTDSPHEAEALTAQAHRLMLKWGIEQADLEARGEIKAEEIVEVSRTWNTAYAIAWVDFGSNVAHGMGHLRTLKSGARSRQTLYVVGHETDVDNFWFLMNSLEHQATSALASWWKASPERGWGLTSQEQYKAKREFLLAFGRAVGKRLREQRVEVEQDATPGAALVLVSKEEKVADWVDNRYGGTLRRGRGMTSGGVGGSAAGHTAGMKASLGEKGIGGSRGQIGRR